jgi:hypothetical protein
MALDVETPDPPDLTMRGTPSDYHPGEDGRGSGDFRREELEAMLKDGAWSEAFEEWGEYTDLDDEEVRAVADLGLFREFDFYWDPDDETLRYDGPLLPDDWRERAPESLRTTSQRSRVETELDDLGRTVLEELQDTYLDWDDDVSEYVWPEGPFGGREE